MSGPRVSTGEDSRQDFRTPADFMAATAKRFGPIGFDLAAHKGNTQHERYFAPTEFVYTGTLDEISSYPGTPTQLFKDAARNKPKLNSNKDLIYEKRVKNDDPAAYALDAFSHSWPDVTFKFGLLWLNPEFSDIERWALRCRLEAERGARILLLTPAAMTNWFRDHVQGVADTYFLHGRLMFDGKNPYPKDCMLSHFHHPEIGGPTAVRLWDWKADKILGAGTWSRGSRFI